MVRWHEHYYSLVGAAVAGAFIAALAFGKINGCSPSEDDAKYMPPKNVDYRCIDFGDLGEKCGILDGDGSKLYFTYWDRQGNLQVVRPVDRDHFFVEGGLEKGVRAVFSAEECNCKPKEK